MTIWRLQRLAARRRYLPFISRALAVGALGCACLAALLAATAAIQRPPRQADANKHRPHQSEKLRLELSVDRQAQEIGQPVWITVTLSNVSDKWFLVEKNVWFSTASGSVKVELRDPKGKPLTGAVAYADYPKLPGHGTDLAEWLQARGKILLPGDFLGFRRTLQDMGFDIKTPGVYEIRASYHCDDLVDLFPSSRQRIAEAKAKLHAPLWSGDIEAKPIFITINE